MNSAHFRIRIVSLFFPAGLFVLSASPRPAAAEDEIGFIERFALAENREAAVEELIPGTEDYYYFSSLLALQEERFDDVESLLEPWRERHGETARATEIRHRLALRRYGEEPAQTLAYLREELGLRFNHQQEKLDARPDFPTELNPEEITWEAFLERALRAPGLGCVEDSGLDRLVREQTPLDQGRRRELLSRLRFPDYERLVGLIASDLRTPESRGFGEFEIHRRLTLEQLDELVGLRPELANDPQFVNARLVRLRPGGDEAPARNPEAREAYLDRLWDYVESLPPAFNSLKASVLYRRLEQGRRKGDFPRDEFLAYLELPRHMPYMSEDYLRRKRGVANVDLNAGYDSTTGFGPIGDDQSLVRDYLEHYFREDESYDRFTPFVRESYLKRVFAETKLLAGIGDPEEWYSLLEPSEVEALKERVEIAFAPGNREHFVPADEVSLSVRLKNVDELIVKVYEINALEYYLDRKREINTDLDLDGLVANEETTHRYDEAPVRRHEETFTFESLADRRGTWVVEFIGNGISSRALVRKGKLQYLSRTTPGGELVTVLTEDNEKVDDASAWFGGQRYEAGDDGRILLPFSRAGEAPVVLSDGEMASLVRLRLPQEQYQLDAGVLLEQETLLPGEEASIAIRPSLRLGNEPVSLDLLDNVTLSIATEDRDGVASVNEVDDPELGDGRETIHSFRVPPRLSRVTVTLAGEIEPVSRSGEPTQVTFSRTFPVNGIDSRPVVADAYLSRFGDRYVLEVLGKSGEALADRAVNVSLTHRDFSRVHETSLKTDGNGRVDLGELDGIATVSCSGAASRTWRLSGDAASRASTVHGVAGEPVVIPHPGVGNPLERAELAVLEMRGGAPYRDAFDRASAGDGAVILEGLEPGDYQVRLRGPGETILVRITDAAAGEFGYALSEGRHLELRDAEPLHLGEPTVEEGALRIDVANADERTRVHLVATRFLPQFDPFEGLNRGPRAQPVRVERGTNESLYVSGRDIGEEYRYILERRSARTFPGNMLSRPGLILNPWELSDTETGVDRAEAGEDYDKGKDMEEAKRDEPATRPSRPVAEKEESGRTPSLEFLARQGVVLTNLEVGEDGSLTVDLEELGDRQHVHVVAANTYGAVYRQLTVPEPEEGARFRDLRLDRPLDTEKTFTQRRNVTLLESGDTLAIDDLRAAELETYDTVGQVYDTLLAVNGGEKLATFGFVTQWPELPDERKRELYSEHACHELHFFLARKDPDFFEAVVRPYLENKKDRTFLDRYLLGEPLDGYLAPWEFGRLNIVERILMARRIGEEERRSTARHVEDLLDLVPPDPRREANFFRQALRGRRAAGEAFAFTGPGGAGATVAARDRQVTEEIESKVGLMMERRSARKADGAPAAPQLAQQELATSRGAEKAENMVAADAIAVEAGAQIQMTGGRKLEELRRRARSQALYEKLEKTKELAENNYYHLPIERQNAELVTVNAFWEDFAQWNGEGGFYSREFPAAARNFTEAMFALSVLDLPFSGGDHEFTVEDNALSLRAESPLVVFHEEIEEAPLSEGDTPILVSQNFFRADDRHRREDGQRVDKFVSDEFLSGVVYGSQVVVTNPTSSAHQLDLLVQVPAGAIPVGGGDYTKSHPVSLNPFSTERVETLFYFPADSAGETFDVYPVQVAKDEQVIASGDPASFPVVDELSQFDEASWEYLSQYGEPGEVLEYLRSANLHRIDLSRIAWRVREDVDFFRQVTELIASRHAYDATLWSYGLHHGVTPVAREYLKHREDFLRQCGDWIDGELVRLEPVERHWYQHLEYAPLVNARAHRLGREQTILNDRFHDQYHSFLRLVSYKPELPAEDRLAVSAYFFLQDRIEEGLDWYDSVDRGQVDEKLQYDYLAAYAAMYRGEPGEAARIAGEHAEHPVDRWRERFAEVRDQVAEIEGEADNDGEAGDREDRMERLSEAEPGFDLTSEGRAAKLTYRNLDAVTVNYYEMDLEFLFSSQPFVSGEGGQFSYVKPNRSDRRELPADGNSLRLELPEEFAGSNVLVEVVAAGRTASAPIYSHSLDVQLSESYGRLQVRHEESGEPLARAYVKVYARTANGQVRFFKDGYTDLRGKFDYTSLNTNEIDGVDELSLLVMSEENGSLVREVEPPQQ